MQRNVNIALLGLVLIAPPVTTLAASRAPKLARCDGNRRRMANTYGSILPVVDPLGGVVTPANAPSVGIDVFPQQEPAKLDRRDGKSLPENKPPAPVPPIGAISPLTTFRSC